MSLAGIRRDLRNLVGQSTVYGLGSIVLRGLTFLLLPVYTRFLSPADYGIVMVTLTIVAILGVFYPLGLHGAISRFYFATDSEGERRERSGTIWVAMLVAAVTTAVLFDVLGARLVPLFLPGIPFIPYVRLAIWIAFFAVFGLVPLNLLQVRERAGTYVALSVAAALMTTTCVLILVVGRKGGAAGYLLGSLIGGALAAIPYTVVALRNVKLVLRRDVLVAALAYSLPLVPHALASWILELSDRSILARYTSLGDVGIYSLGYQVGTALGLLVAAFNSAWVPYLFKTLAAGGHHADRRLSRMASYYAMALTFAALGLALLVGPILRLLVAPAFQPAARITPWVVGGYLLSGLYVIPIGLLFWKEQTKRIPVVTLVAGLVNVGLNLWLIPRYGAIAAAWSTMVAYGLMLLIAWGLARGLYPFPYEYSRLGRILAMAMALYALGTLLPYPSPGLEVMGKIAVWLAFPAGLALIKVFEPAELQALYGMARSARARLV